MRRRLLAAVGIAVLLMAFSPMATLAGPTSPPNYGTYNPTNLPDQPPEEWGVEKAIPSPSTPGGVIRIITDPLEGSAPAGGWVTFWCQSRLGFQYNIGATGLDPLSKYSVRAVGIQVQIVAPGTPGAFELEPGVWILPSTTAPIELDLGGFSSDAKGSGGVKGVSRLSGGHAYDLTVLISDESGSVVLSSPGYDTNGFLVF